MAENEFYEDILSNLFVAHITLFFIQKIINFDVCINVQELR